MLSVCKLQWDACKYYGVHILCTRSIVIYKHITPARRRSFLNWRQFKIVDWDYFKIKYLNEIIRRDNSIRFVKSENVNAEMKFVAK